MDEAKAIKQTYTGRMVNLLDPQPHDIDMVDMAHALSLTNRFGGHSRWPYPVAQHCVHAAEIAAGKLYDAEPDDVLCCLLHDAAETYVGDMIAPLKHIQSMAAYRAVEDRLEHVLAMRFGIVYPWPKLVKEIDMLLLATEARDLLNEPEYPWPGTFPKPLENFRITPWCQPYAEHRFIEMLKELRPLKGVA